MAAAKFKALFNCVFSSSALFVLFLLRDAGAGSCQSNTAPKQ